MRRCVTAIWLMIASLTSVGSPRAARAGETPQATAREVEAREHYAQGVELYRARRYALALSQFEQAYALHADPRLLFTLGQVQYELEEYARAVLSLRAYLQQARGIPPERRDLVTGQLASLQQKTGYLAVFVDVPGATISVDGEKVGVSPLRRLLVDIGEHRIGASHPGYLAASAQVQVTPGELTQSELTLIPGPSEASEISSTPFWITTAGLGTLAIVSGVATMISHRHYEQALRTPQNGDPLEARAKREDDRSRIETLALVTDALTAATVVSGGLALYFELRSSESQTPAVGGRRPGPSHVEIDATFEF
jgi:tetratricopeptide (TPR) repeat protein